MMLQLLAVLVLGLMCGSELNAAAITHPVLNRQPLEVHAGAVFPGCVAGESDAILDDRHRGSPYLLLLPPMHLQGIAWRFAAVAWALQIAVVIFSLIGPVPINGRIAKWTCQSVPPDWKAQEHRWDVYHWWRTGSLVLAFGCLVLSISSR
jgi:hypothetical protein